MPTKKNPHPKSRLHTRNKNRERYNLNALKTAVPELKNHIALNKYGVETVNFANPVAVKLLNKALLKHYYGISYWEFPDENLCPPIPGRADYIHQVADLLSGNVLEDIPTGTKITCLDIGIGASCIYPIIGTVEYGWKFIGSDISPTSIATAHEIINVNPLLTDSISCILQTDPKHFFQNILAVDDKVDATICNPPFHASLEDAKQGTIRKIKNLSGKIVKTPKLNFSGVDQELVYEGGEFAFISNMIRESKNFSNNCYWFTSLVSKQSNLKRIHEVFKEVDTTEIKEIAMGTGNKSSRILAWTFLTNAEKKDWRRARW